MKAYLRIATNHPDFALRLRQIAARRGGNYLPPMRADFGMVLLPVAEALEGLPWLAAEVTANRVQVLTQDEAQALLRTPAWRARDVLWGPLTKFARGEITRAVLQQAIAERRAALIERDAIQVERAAAEVERRARAADEERKAEEIRRR